MTLKDSTRTTLYEEVAATLHATSPQLQDSEKASTISFFSFCFFYCDKSYPMFSIDSGIATGGVKGEVPS